jgi:hypothetical protein
MGLKHMSNYILMLDSQLFRLVFILTNVKCLLALVEEQSGIYL